MAGKIPQSFIDELLARVDIVDVIDSRVPLKKKGKDFMACCPFHGEKTPSFSVSQDKQFYYCFGCNASGSALGFLMDYEHLGFVEAIEALAAQTGMEVPRETGDAEHAAERRANVEPLYAVVDKASQYYRQQLREHAQSARAIGYLKERGLSGEIVTAFGIGFAPPGWDNLIKQFGGDDKQQASLTEAGMVIEKEDKRYDRFRDRIMIPILDKRGRTIAFGGRVLGDDKPKYLNSPESPIFHKGRELYGLYQARKALRNLPRLLVVEGYMDVIALAQFGIRYAVATLGTATTAEHLEMAFRTTPEVVFCFDGDRAGRDAAWRALENALPVIREGREAKFLFLPDGEDPDTLIRKEGHDAFEARVKNATPLSEYLLENLSHRTDINSVDGAARMVELAKPLFSKIGPGLYREMLTDKLAALAQMDSERLSGHLYAVSKQPEPPAAVERKPVQRVVKRPTSGLGYVAKAVRCLLHQPSIAQSVVSIDALETIEEPGMNVVIELLRLLKAQPDMHTASIIEHWRDKPLGQRFAELAADPPLLNDAEVLEAEFGSILVKMQELTEANRQRQHLEELRSKQFVDLSDDEKNPLRNQRDS